MFKILIICLLLSQGLLSSLESEKVKNDNISVPTEAHTLEVQSRISYEINGHNLGDNLMSYLRGKWLSFHYNIPLLYKPFPFANQFNLHGEEKKKFKPILLTKFEAVHSISNELDLCFEDPSNILYVIPTFTESEIEFDDDVPFLEIDWQAKDFRKLLKKLIKPAKSITGLAIPRQRISIAVYMPAPTEKEGEEVKQTSPLKYPPDSYYIEQINKLDDLFYHRPLYVYLFTENRNPAEVIKKFTKSISKHNILFECKTSHKMTRSSSVEDFFNMGEFNCLIRPMNNLGFLLEQMNNYLITVKPVHHKMVNNNVYIDNTFMKFQEK